MKKIWRRKAVFCPIAMAILLSSGVVAVAEPPQSTVEFSIPAQPLSTALIELAKQAKVQILTAGYAVEGLNAAPVSGRFTLGGALQRMLQGSGFTYRFIDEKTVVLVKDDAARSSENSAALQEVIVTAQKRAERLQDVPVPVSVVNTQSLSENNQTLLKDYYTQVPGLVVQPGILAQQVLAIRGLGTGGGGGPGSTVGILIDGVPYGGTMNGSGGFWLPDFDPGDLERIEVLRGPQGTLYGSNSLGGLINFVTVSPSTAGDSGRLQAGYSSVYNGAEPGFDLRGSVNLAITDTLAIRISGFDRQDPGYIDNPVLGTRGVNEAWTDGAHFTAMWRPLQDVSLKLGALYQKAHSAAASDVDVALWGGPTGLKDLQQNYIPNIGGYEKIAQAYSAILTAKLGPVDFTSLTGFNQNYVYSSLDFSYVFRSLVAAVPEFGGVDGAAFNDYVETRRINQEFHFSGALWERLDWLAGGFYSHETAFGYPQQNILAENATTGQIMGAYYVFTEFQPSVLNQYALFADLTVHINDRWDIQFGGRHSRLNFNVTPGVITGPYTNGTPQLLPGGGSTANPSNYLVTPRFKLSQDLMLYARFASGYRPGTPSTGAPPGIPPQSNPDTASTYEFGFKGDLLDHALTLDASVYYIDWKGIQISLVDPRNSFEYFANGGTAKSQGVEFSLAAHPLKGLALSGWVSYDEAVLTSSFPKTAAAAGGYGVEGDRLPNAPRWSAHTSIRQDFPFPHWNNVTGFIGGDVSYVGDRVAGFNTGPQRQDLPAYTKVDLRTGITDGLWTVNIYANNVADARGLLSGGPGADPPYGFQYITPRTLGVTVVRTF